ncbi:hypothetical protein N9850_00805 [Granulosicoccus sp.]|nr:hypothetical protein [Granulosicoccus sp.]MDB4222283.1 hypothetical protein [Granulosicoccus sp.]
MAESHVISALVEKHARLLGEIAYHRKMIQRLQQSVEVTGQSIKLFDPSYKLSRIKPIRRRLRSDYFKQGQCTILILDLLREADGPIDTNTLLDMVLLREGLVIDAVESAAILVTIKNVLRGLARRGAIVKTPAVAGVNTWTVA